MALSILHVSLAKHTLYLDCSSTQFRCSNGLCVSSSFRCNGRTGGCSDGSDERNCSKFPIHLTVTNFCNLSGHSREISCFSSTTRTDLPIVLLLKTQYNYVCTASAINDVIEAFGKHGRNLAMSSHEQLHFAVFLQSSFCAHPPCPPALIFSHFHDEKQDISLLWP